MSKQFEKEILNIRTLAEKEANKKQNKLMNAYKNAMDNIQGEIGKIYAKQSVDGVLNVSNKQRLAILKSLDGQLRAMYNDLGKLDQQITLDILLKSYEEAYYKTLYTIDRGLSTAISFDLLNPKIIEKAVSTKYKGATFSDRIWTSKKHMISKLKNNVNQAIIEGKSIDKLARDIKNTFGTTAYESQRLMQNEVKNVMTNAQQKIYEDSPVVQKIMWSATLDDSTRDEHQDLDGKTWDTDEPHPSPSDFVMCRCALIPVVEGWNPSKRIDNETKDTIKYTNYNDWKANKGID